MHVHVRKGYVEAKSWLYPEVTLAYNDGYDAGTLRELAWIVKAHRGQIERTRNEFFG
jgi:hypothetical protein